MDDGMLTMKQDGFVKVLEGVNRLFWAESKDNLNDIEIF
jgi:hypothetical protein